MIDDGTCDRYVAAGFHSWEMKLWAHYDWTKGGVHQFTLIRTDGKVFIQLFMCFSVSLRIHDVQSANQHSLRCFSHHSIQTSTSQNTKVKGNKSVLIIKNDLIQSLDFCDKCQCEIHTSRGITTGHIYLETRFISLSRGLNTAWGSKAADGEEFIDCTTTPLTPEGFTWTHRQVSGAKSFKKN